MRALATRPVLLVALLAAWPHAAPADGPVFRSSGPPPGFEAFHERQRTLVDVYYGGEFLLTTPASFDIEHIRFDDPELLTSLIPDLHDPDAVAEALSGDLDTHEALRCVRPGQEDCGRLEPASAGVIFDPTRFRATVFVNPDLLETRGPQVNRFLPRSDAGFSFLQNVFANVSGAERSTENYNVASVTAIGYRETHLEMFSSYGADDDVTIDSLSLRREYEGTAWQTGLYRSRGQSLGFVTERDLYGMRFGRALNTRADRAFSDGTPIEVFLPNRARVEIIKDGRLLSSRFYDPGNRVLDTSGLPEGAYDIVLRIREADGSERIEERFFVKSTRLPPADQPLYFMEVGRIADRNTPSTLPEDTGTWLARAGTTRRIGRDSGIDVGMAVSEGRGLAEAGVFHVTRSAEFQASGFIGNGDARGLAAITRMDLGRMRLTADYRRVKRDDAPDLRRSLTGPAFEQFGLTARMPFAGGNLGLSMRVIDRDDSGRRDSQNLSWERTLLRTMAGWWRFTMDLSRQDGDWLGLVGVRLNIRGEGYTGTFTPRLRWDDNERGDGLGHQTDGRLAWHRHRPGGADLLTAVSASSDPDHDRVGFDGEYQGRLGLLRADVDHDFGEGTTWTGTLNTSLISDGRRLVIGGRDQSQAAALVDIRGEVPDAEFEVRVDGFSRGVAPAGSVTPIHLRPWETYDIRLRPTGTTFVTFEDRSERITLYPGNVIHITWDVAEVLVVFGRLLDAAGQPLEGLRLEGAQGLAVTDIGGLFQAEVLRPRSDTAIELAAVRDGRACRFEIRVDDLELRNGIARVGTQRCRWEAEE